MKTLKRWIGYLVWLAIGDRQKPKAIEGMINWYECWLLFPVCEEGNHAACPGRFTILTDYETYICTCVYCRHPGQVVFVEPLSADEAMKYGLCQRAGDCTNDDAEDRHLPK
jgi:hypothetical protein